MTFPSNPDCVQVLRGPHDATSRIFWDQYARVMAAKNIEPCVVVARSRLEREVAR